MKPHRFLNKIYIKNLFFIFYFNKNLKVMNHKIFEFLYFKENFQLSIKLVMEKSFFFEKNLALQLILLVVNDWLSLVCFIPFHFLQYRSEHLLSNPWVNKF